jgi:hypothetical protein
MIQCLLTDTESQSDRRQDALEVRWSGCISDQSLVGHLSQGPPYYMSHISISHHQGADTCDFWT